MVDVDRRRNPPNYEALIAYARAGLPAQPTREAAMDNRPADYCPARIIPLPPGVPTRRQLRGVVAGDTLTVLWLDAGGRVCLVQVPAADYQARQAGCRCTANPRLTAADLSRPTRAGAQS
jgi:hypothetical protein